jgi:hypothetical protein
MKKEKNQTEKKEKLPEGKASGSGIIDFSESEKKVKELGLIKGTDEYEKVYHQYVKIIPD